MSLFTIFKGGGQKDGWDPVFSGGAGEPGEEVQETGENLGNGDCIGNYIDKSKDNVTNQDGNVNGNHNGNTLARRRSR